MLLRHTLATLAYRLGKVLRDAPAAFAGYPEGDSQCAVKVVAHIGDLMDWALSMVNGQMRWRDSAPLSWEAEVARCFAAIEALDVRLAEVGAGAASEERLFQGPIADALTHTGQLAMMRRLAGMKMKGENYYKATVKVGVVGLEQASSLVEF
jgi:hypothetical protein